MISQRPTKIICTLGPSTSDYRSIKRLIQSGMDVARLNFSHGTWEDHKESISLLRRAGSELSKEIGILQDLSGPKIRLGDIPGGLKELNPGDHIRLTSKFTVDAGGASDSVPIEYEYLEEDLPPGGKVLVMTAADSKPPTLPYLRVKVAASPASTDWLEKLSIHRMGGSLLINTGR